MIDEHSVLGVILARGGSKGLPRKNIRDLAGKPLIAWTIEAGHESEYLDRLILSSDDKEIMEVAENYGCEVPFQRPAELARDETPSIDALLHVLDQVESHQYVVMLQPTSPLRTAEDIDGTIVRCHRNDGCPCVTVTETDKPPQWMYTLDKDNQLVSAIRSDSEVARRQEASPTYAINGAGYAADTNWLRETESFLSEQTCAHVMPKARSADVDDKLDLAWCRFLKNQMHRQGEGM